MLGVAVRLLVPCALALLLAVPGAAPPALAQAWDLGGTWEDQAEEPAEDDEAADGADDVASEEAAVEYGEPATEENAPDADAYELALSPHGDWVDTGDYGRVWDPWVGAGWQPYVDGYWGWGSYGWTWISYEPWAWTFHYGRWAFAPAYGWVWVPGTVWGPAWVDWYWGGGWVGWAPLGFPGFAVPINQFVFVSGSQFCARGLSRHVVGHRRLPDNVIHHWRRRDPRPPDRHQIERVAKHDVVRIGHRPPASIAPQLRGAHRLRRPDTSPDRGRGRRGGGQQLAPASGAPYRARGLAVPGRTGRGARLATPSTDVEAGVVPHAGRGPSRPLDPGRDRAPQLRPGRPSPLGFRAERPVTAEAGRFAPQQGSPLGHSFGARPMPSTPAGGGHGRPGGLGMAPSFGGGHSGFAPQGGRR